MIEKSILNYQENVVANEIVYGIHAVRHALQQVPHNVLEIWVEKDKRLTLADLLRQSGVVVKSVSRHTLDKLSEQGVHQGVVLRRKMSVTTVELHSLLENTPQPMVLVLDGVQDPHNLGACLRTADATGIAAVVVPKNRAVKVNATVHKVACGAADRVPVITVTNLARALREMHQKGLWIIGATDDTQEEIYSANFQLPFALVLGSEGRGLRENTRKQCNKLVAIPMAGAVASLNVSVAAGVCLYEALRQRRKFIN